MTNPDTSASPAQEDRTVAILSYLTIIGFIVAIVLHGSRKTKIGAFHLRQSLGLVITAIVFWPCTIVLAFIPILGWLAILVGWCALLLFVILGLIGAATGRFTPVPLLGDNYQAWFANAFT